MILGVGSDLIEIDRIQASIDRFGGRFLEKVFTPGEIAYCRAKRRGAAESFAARFAAKEAAAKALGTGIARGVAWLDLEVTRSAGQPPRIELHGRAAQRARALGVVRTALTLTHSRTCALAVVLLES